MSKREEHPDYLESDSIDGHSDDGLQRAGSGLAAAEERLQNEQRDRATELLFQRRAAPAYNRQLTVSGLKVPRELSFYRREHVRQKQAGGGGQKMLTCDQLSDLFRRLDRNGNGTLDKFEFTDIVKKLRLDVSEQFLLGVFQEVDSKTKVKGTLTLRDFIQCYQILYYETSHNAHSSKKHPNSYGYVPQVERAECIHAIRYGHDTVTDKYVYEVYSGHSIGGTIVIDEKKVFDHRGGMGRYTVEQIDVDLGHLNLLMAQDALHNSTNNSHLFWWVDVAMEQVTAPAVEKYIINFGLPNDSRFRSRFSQFGDPLPCENNGNFHAGNGDTNLGSTSTLSLFSQAIWMSSVPIVYNTAPETTISKKWAQYMDSSVQEWVQHYYDTRFAFMLAAFVSAPPSLRPQAYDSARSLALRFNEASDLEVEFPDDELDQVEEEKDRVADKNDCLDGANPSSHRSILSMSSGRSYSQEDDPKVEQTDDAFSDVPIFMDPNRRKDEPTWLQETHPLRKETSRIVFESMGMHMIDMGYGPIVTLTIRQLDDEGAAEREQLEAKKSSEGAKARLQSFRGHSQRSRLKVGTLAGQPGENAAQRKARKRARLVANSCKGVLGRLLVGVRRKLLENFYCRGVTAFAADIADGPFSLVVHITSLVNNFSMNTMGHLENWKVRLENEVNDLAVSKHINHAHELQETVSHIREYVDHFHEKIETFVIEAANEQATQCLVDEVGGGDGPSTVQTEKTVEVKRKLTASGVWGLLRSVRKVVDKKVHTHSIFPKGIEGTDLSYDMIKSFFGKDPMGDLNALIYGNENLELTGLEYWQHRMSMLHATTRVIGQEIRESLDEKRNFYNYLLAVVTVFLGPMTILTGYWGMNFENMPELSVDKYSWFPGVKLLWAWGGLLYGIFFLMAIHYRILYSAT